MAKKVEEELKKEKVKVRREAGPGVVGEDLKPFVVFRLGDEEFGVDVMQIREIARTTTITRVPRSPRFIDGVINLRGSLASVVNLRRRFGFEPKPIDENSRIVIAELEDRPVGMLVDAATEVLRIPSSDIEMTPEMVTTEISRDYLQGVGKVGDRLIILLDLMQVLTREEMEEIRVFEEEKVSRLEEKVKRIEKEKEKKAEKVEKREKIEEKPPLVEEKKEKEIKVIAKEEEKTEGKASERRKK